MKSVISDYTIKAVKDIPITNVLDSQHVEYKKIGKEAITLCPWHNDRNPSLTINDEKSLCYCFVCQTGDDGIGFIQAKLGLSFAEAVEKIAISNNIEVIYENLNPELALKEARRKVQLMNQLTTEHESYRRFLKDPRAQRIRDFLDARDIEPATSKHFQLGYCPRGFFGDRITVPIHDHIGTLVGFAGRATSNTVKPKFKNSENSEYFDKSKLVFNEHRAIQHIREADSLVFVEGHFDVISLWQFGIKNVVALQGTATPSDSILHRLARRTKRFILCFDADEGGLKATEAFIKSAGPMACRGDLSLSVAQLPDGKDPEDCINSGLDLFSIIESAKPWLDWQLDVWLKSVDRSDTARYTEIEARIRALVESIHSPTLRQYYIDKASLALSQDPESAAKTAKDWFKNTSTIKSRKRWLKPSPLETRMMVERRLLRLYIHFPELRPDLVGLMDRLYSPAHKWLWQRLREIEDFSDGVSMVETLLAVYCVSEPHYTRQLRSIAMPTIKVHSDSGIMDHIKNILSQELVVNGI